VTPGCFRHRRRLFWKIYFHGLLLLLVAGAGVSVLALRAGPESIHHGKLEGLSKVLAAELAPRLDDPSGLAAMLSRVQGALGTSLAVYRPDGTLLGRAGTRPPDALRPREAGSVGERAFFRKGRSQVLAVRLPDGAYLLVARPHPKPGRFLFAVAAVLLAAALLSYPVARAISVPLERLTATSRRLAQGDLSARSGIRREDEVGTLAGALDDMASRLEERIRNEREILANVSHELRTPLARLRVALELCEEEGDLAAVKDHLAGIAEDVAELERLVADVLAATRLDLAASEGKGFPLNRAPVRLAELAAEASVRFGRNHPEHELRLAVSEDLPEVVADRALLGRVLDNLLENSARYSDPGAPVELRARAEAGAVTVEVADRGIGVAEEDLPRLFEPFFRTDRSRSRQAGGTGLGLTLCKRVVEAHGGTIWAEPNPGGGLVVGFRQPVVR
jgi:signal transduction histidine kinase